MAGLDTDIGGEAFMADGATVGFLSQEPDLTPGKTVKECVDEAVSETRGILDRFDELSMKLGEDLSPEDMDRVLEEQGQVQDRIEAAGAWDLDSKLELAMEALRLPPGDGRGRSVRRRTAPACALCQVLLRQPDSTPGRAHQPPGRRVGGMAGASSHEYPGTVVAVTHDRYFLDNVAGWILELDRGAGIPWEGNYSSWLEQKERRLARRRKEASARRRTLQKGAGVGAHEPQSRHAKGKARISATMISWPRTRRRRSGMEAPRSPSLPAPGWGSWCGGKGCREGVRGTDSHGGRGILLPAGGIVGVVGPNGAGKTTLFRMIVGEESPDAGTLSNR